MYIFTPRLRLYSVLVLGYMFAFLIAALAMNNQEFLFYQGTMIAIILVVVFMDKRVQFSPIVLGGLAIWGFVHMAGGLIPIGNEWAAADKVAPVLYDFRAHPYMPKYDQMVHAFGFGVSLIAAYEALCAHFKRVLPLNAAIGATVLLIAMGLGALNELIEFAAVMLLPDTNVGGYINTGWDLVSNATGAVIALSYLCFVKRGQG